MDPYTRTLPKAMLVFAEKTLLEWQIETLRGAGIRDIVVVTGYQGDAITCAGITRIHNERFAATNMVATLMCARGAFGGEILVAYSDILYSPALVERLANARAEFSVAVDSAWRELWMKRYGTTETDLESLSVSEDGLITEIGRPVSTSAGLLYRYIGLLKFSESGTQALVGLYDEKRRRNAPWTPSGKPFLQGYMTDLLQELILRGHAVYPVVTRGGWYEFDTASDYEIARHLSLADILGSR
jgi:choline kinase